MKCSALLRLLAATVVIGLALPGAAAAATKSSSIDFDSVSSPVSPTGEGLIVDRLSSGSGISGDPLTGEVGVFGQSMDPNITTNAALIFDATCSVDAADGVPEDCTGKDADLFKPELRNVLIVAENLRDSNGNGRMDDPDDADDRGQTLSFDFSKLETGSVRIKSLDVLDVDDDEAGGEIRLYSDGTSLGSVPIPLNGDNGLSTIPVNREGVDRMEVVLAGSGAIDNLRLEADEPEQLGGEGCTPGYWKQPHHFDSWGPTGYSPTDRFDEVFGVSYNPNLTLLDALQTGGGKFKRLGRHAVAALLNAKHPDVDYAMTSSEVIQAVRQAFATGDPDPVANQLENGNEMGCPLD